MADYDNKAYWENLVKMSLSRYFVMYALSQKPMHGYDISKWIGEVTKGCCCPTEGSLYPMLKEFEKGNYVTSETLLVSGRERKVYTLTDKGLETLSIGKEVWGGTADIIQATMQYSKENLLLCPACNSKTRTKAYMDTELLNFPLFCPKCKKETIVNVRQLKITVV